MKRKRPFELAFRTQANAMTMWALQRGIPWPPYSRRNALILETVGRRSRKPRRMPAGYLDDGAALVVVAENGERSGWVRDALQNEGRLRVYVRGDWKDAHLRVLAGDADQYLQRMNKMHASLVRRHSIRMPPKAVEITCD